MPVSRSLTAAAIAFGLFAANTLADEDRFAGKKEAYQALLAQYSSTVAKGLKNKAETEYWGKFITTDDPVHVRITKVSSINLKDEYSRWIDTDGRSGKFLYKSMDSQSDENSVWRIEVFGEMTPSVNSIVVFIGTTSKRVLTAFYNFGE